MGEEKYTPEGMIIISKGVVETLIRDYGQRKNEGYQSMDKYASELVGKIFKENPPLAIFLQKMEESYSKNSKGFINFCHGFGSMYELFQRQNEINKLEEAYQEK